MRSIHSVDSQCILLPSQMGRAWLWCRVVVRLYLSSLANQMSCPPQMKADVHREVLAKAVDHVPTLALGLVLGVNAEKLCEHVGTLKGVLFLHELSCITVGDLHSISSNVLVVDATLHPTALCHRAAS